MMGFYDFKSLEITRGLKRFLGGGNTLAVRWLFLDGDTILVRFMDEWIPVWFSQVKKYMPCEHSRRA